MRETQRRLAAVWFADLVDYTRLAAENEDAALELVGDLQAASRQVVEGHAGRIVKFVGDAVLAEFASLHEAMRSALALPVELSRRRVESGRGSRPVRVGLHVGELATTPDGDVLGDGVNVAARIQSIAGPDQVVCSEDVVRQLRRRKEFGFQELGERALKGLAEPVRLFAARRADDEKTGLPDSSPTAGAPPHSIAVLPFANMSASPENEYFSDGVTEEILTALAQVGDLKVISRTSVMSYKGTSKSLRQIADELGVATILEGSVRRAGPRVRIAAQLIDAGTDRHLWAERYDRDLEDIFAIQADVAERIVEALKVHLTPGERARLRDAPKVSQAAYEAYLKGLWFWNRRTLEDLRRAEAHFSEAIAVDPAYAPAHAGRACACVLQLHWGEEGTVEARDRALEEAERALAMDSASGDAYAARAQVRIYDRDWTGAERDFRRAIEIAPGDATARQWYAEFLACMGRFDEAYAEVERARELDPLSLAVVTEAGNIHFFTRRYVEAERLYRHVLELDSRFEVARWKLVDLFQAQGRLDRSLDEMERIDTVTPEEVAAFRGSLARGAEGAEPLVERLEQSGWPRFYAAALFAAMGRREEAFDRLDRAFAERDWYLVRTAVSPHMDPLRDDPRFTDLLKRLGLDHVRPAIAPEPTGAREQES